jgi:hypothetical protein
VTTTTTSFFTPSTPLKRCWIVFKPSHRKLDRRPTRKIARSASTPSAQRCTCYLNYDDVYPKSPIASGLQFEQFLLQVKEAFGLGDTARLWVLYNTSQGCSTVTSEPAWQDAPTPTFQIRPACVRSNRIGQAARLHIDSQASLWSSGASPLQFTSFTLAKLCVFTLIRPSIFT